MWYRKFETSGMFDNLHNLGYKKIAFSYGASYYNDICPHPNKNLGKALGRIQVISQLFKDKIINKSDSIHLSFVIKCASSKIIKSTVNFDLLI